MIRHKLPECLGNCPEGWRNFIEDLRSRVEPDDHGGYLSVTIQNELSKFDALWNDCPRLGANLIFNDERLYTVFVLKYGLL